MSKTVVGLGMFGRLSAKLEQIILPGSGTLQITALLKWQERLLDRKMSTADMMLYEMRSQQISDLIRHLPAAAPSGPDAFTGRR